MNKFDTVLVMPDQTFLENAVSNLNLDNVNLVAVMTETADDAEPLTINQQIVLHVDFSAVKELLNQESDTLWLICGCLNGIEDIRRAKERLTADGVPEDKIINFELAAQINFAWLANLRHVEKNGADFFVTGASLSELGLDFKYMPGGTGVNLADCRQDLRQSYLTAKHVFEHVAPGSVKFVLIGIEPFAFDYDDLDSFAVFPKNFQYELAFNDAPNFSALRRPELLNEIVKEQLKPASVEKPDLNFDNTKAYFKQLFPNKMLLASKGDMKFLTAADIDKNLQILNEYIALCRAHGAKPVGVIIPFPSATKNFVDEKILETFRQKLRTLEKDSDFFFADLSVANLLDNYFYSPYHLNLKGAVATSVLLSTRLFGKEIVSSQEICNMSSEYFDVLSKMFPKNYNTVMAQIFTDIPYDNFKQLSDKIPKESFCDLLEQFFFDMPYDEFKKLSKTLPKDEYNDFMAQTFAASERRLSRAKKIKVGFVIFNSSMWCGDELYNLFARDERFEPTVFLCRSNEDFRNMLVQDEFTQSVERFKSHGLNLVLPTSIDDKMPPQDILILLSPYVPPLPRDFRTSTLTVKTLMINIPHSLSISKRDEFLDSSLFHVVWKMFFSSTIELELQDKMCSVGMPRGIYSGYSKMDEFFDPNRIFSFSWKLTRPDAKKIIYAPHWSINASTKYATFQWNYQFMYEFAKAHPEISWVVKPHPALFFSALDENIFPSSVELEEYFQKWDDLPNAQVYTGNYYQSIFATSDGMIHDSGSFIAEYQYVDKPMIFLTREGEVFNELGEKILAASYPVDGKDFDAISAAIQKIFLQGNDDKYAERKAVFDEYLNYPKYLGMSASKFIYRSIAEALKPAVGVKGARN